MDAAHTKILIRGAGELASATAHHLHRHGFTRILMLERRHPKAVRRNVCFCEAVYEGIHTVEGVRSRFVTALEQIDLVHNVGDIAVSILDLESVVAFWRPDVFIEAAMLRENWGLTRKLAPVVIALGPGFVAGRDCHAVVETVRGPGVGAVLEDTGERVPDQPPAEIMGFAMERVLKAARDGIFFTQRKIGEEVERGEKVGMVVSVYGIDDYRKGVPVDASYAVTARISGVIRGLLRDGSPVKTGHRIADVDPRGRTDDLDHISDKSRRVAEGVHEALLGLVELAPAGEAAESTG